MKASREKMKRERERGRAILRRKRGKKGRRGERGGVRGRGWRQGKEAGEGIWRCENDGDGVNVGVLERSHSGGGGDVWWWLVVL